MPDDNAAYFNSHSIQIQFRYYVRGRIKTQRKYAKQINPNDLTDNHFRSLKLVKQLLIKNFFMRCCICKNGLSVYTFKRVFYVSMH